MPSVFIAIIVYVLNGYFFIFINAVIIVIIDALVSTNFVCITAIIFEFFLIIFV